MGAADFGIVLGWLRRRRRLCRDTEAGALAILSDTDFFSLFPDIFVAVFFFSFLDPLAEWNLFPRPFLFFSVANLILAGPVSLFGGRRRACCSSE